MVSIIDTRRRSKKMSMMDLVTRFGRAKPEVPPTEKVHTMFVMDRTGHTTVTWNPEDAESVRSAREEFKQYIKDGYQAFEMDLVKENGVLVEKNGTKITRFDPELGKVMMVPQLVGG